MPSLESVFVPGMIYAVGDPRRSMMLKHIKRKREAQEQERARAELRAEKARTAEEDRLWREAADRLAREQQEAHEAARKAMQALRAARKMEDAELVEQVTALAARPRPTLQDAFALVDLIAEKHRMRRDDLYVGRRSRDCVEFRHECFIEVHKLCPHWSYSQLGRFFRRDHTTIIYTLRKWRKAGAGE